MPRFCALACARKWFCGKSPRPFRSLHSTSLTVDPSRSPGWTVSARFNSGDARVSGVEMNFKHSFEQMSGWPRYFSVFVNGTKLRLEGHQLASFSEFIPESMNWGFSFKKNPLIFMAKWNYRGKQVGTAQPTHRAGCLPLCREARYLRSKYYSTTGKEAVLVHQCTECI
jgi:hypothetical protein